MKNFKISTKQEFFAYRILKGDKIYKKSVEKKYDFDYLLKILKPFNSEFFKDYKIWLVLIIKWEFDYLCRKLLNPKILDASIKKYTSLTRVIINLASNNWLYETKILKKKVNEWTRTNKSFNFMWPRNTKGKYYNISKKIISPRVKQFVDMMPKNFLLGKKVLDSGCGPARYMFELMRYKPALLVGMDQGKNIISSNKKKFRKNKKMNFVVGDVGKKLKFKNESFDLVVSSGVLHHSKNPIEKSIKEHARVIKKGGYFFVFIVGTNGTQLKMWDFCRNLLEDVDINYVFDYLSTKISPLRLQGFLDHSYGEYQETKRSDFEKMLKRYFRSFRRVKGVLGADCTPEIYKKDKYFRKRFGDGDLRYICKK